MHLTSIKLSFHRRHMHFSYRLSSPGPVLFCSSLQISSTFLFPNSTFGPLTPFLLLQNMGNELCADEHTPAANPTRRSASTRPTPLVLSLVGLR